MHWSPCFCLGSAPLLELQGRKCSQKYTFFYFCDVFLHPLVNNAPTVNTVGRTAWKQGILYEFKWNAIESEISRFWYRLEEGHRGSKTNLTSYS